MWGEGCVGVEGRVRGCGGKGVWVWREGCVGVEGRVCGCCVYVTVSDLQAYKALVWCVLYISIMCYQYPVCVQCSVVCAYTIIVWHTISTECAHVLTTVQQLHRSDARCLDNISIFTNILAILAALTKQ